MNLKKNIAAALATGALLANLATPAFAATGTLVISGNGVESDSTAAVTSANTTSVVQSNDDTFKNYVDVKANTGNNTADRNTGGEVGIATGDAISSVTIENMANLNRAVVEDCNCAPDWDVTIEGNGDKSDNTAALTSANTTTVWQDNDAYFKNKVDVNANTGKNDANRNTGGDVSIDTGEAVALVEIANAANLNSAMVVGGGDSEAGGVSAMISGNGVESDSTLALTLAKTTTLTQFNDADFYNDVDVKANTGKNDANRNTGGEVAITTGPAGALVALDNMANFNIASVDCDCVFDVLAKILGNGDKSKNVLAATVVDTLSVFQDNDEGGADFNNYVDVAGDTGYNDSNRNTGEVGGDSDPSIETSESFVEVALSNLANGNLFGDVEFEFDLSDLGLLLGLFH